ncbi:MAG: hypothetical protein ABEI07_00120 [Candidatus Nanohaloarchaea archaeon]
MGIFDDLMGGGEEDEEIKENIEQIREKVQGERRSEGRSEGTPEPPVSPDEISGSGEGEGRRREPPGPGEGGTGERKPPEPSGEEGGFEAGVPGRAPESPPEMREGGREEPEPEAEGPTREDVPEPPELKDLDVPDIEKGPLFITVDKFRDALDAVSDLRRVASEMDDYVGSMEGTLQEDRDTEEGVRRILDEAEEDTEELKDIVSP